MCHSGSSSDLTLRGKEENRCGCKSGGRRASWLGRTMRVGPVRAHAHTCARPRVPPTWCRRGDGAIMGQQFMLVPPYRCACLSCARRPSPLYLLSLERQPFSTIGRPGCFHGLTLPACSVGKAVGRPFVVHTLGHTCSQTRVNAQLWCSLPFCCPAPACWFPRGSGCAPGSALVISRMVSK